MFASELIVSKSAKTDYYIKKLHSNILEDHLQQKDFIIINVSLNLKNILISGVSNDKECFSES